MFALNVVKMEERVGDRGQGHLTDSALNAIVAGGNNTIGAYVLFSES